VHRLVAKRVAGAKTNTLAMITLSMNIQVIIMLVIAMRGMIMLPMTIQVTSMK
jgi:hypothetical protein